MNRYSGGTHFEARSIEGHEDPLSVLKRHLKENRPVAIQYMTSPTNAHWVVVTGTEEKRDGTHLQVQSWGNYYDVRWEDIQNNWRRGYGGPYPHVVGNSAAPALK